MALPISRKKLDQLGDRLRDAPQPAEADLDQLEAVLLHYGEVLDQVAAQLRGLGFSPTVRVKTTPTLIDKLRRNRSSSLKTIQDLAGARIVIDGRMSDQQQACDRIVDAFEADGWEVGVDDRRVEPSQGYRALHVIVKLDKTPVEIQLRTGMQDLWAQIYERLGDIWGRQIRYGDPPDVVIDSPKRNTWRAEVIGMMAQLSRDIEKLEHDFDDYIVWPPSSRPPSVDETPPELQKLVIAADAVIEALLAYEASTIDLLNTIGRELDREADAN